MDQSLSGVQEISTLADTGGVSVFSAIGDFLILRTAPPAGFELGSYVTRLIGTDGTSAGTSVVNEFGDTASYSFVGIDQIGQLRNRTIYEASFTTLNTGFVRLFATSGTAPSTSLIGSYDVVGSLHTFAATPGRLILRTSTPWKYSVDNPYTTRLIGTDGSADGTGVLLDVPLGTSVTFVGLAGNLAIVGVRPQPSDPSDSPSVTLYSTSGAVAETHIVKSFAGYSTLEALTTVGRRLIMLVGGGAGKLIYGTDGTGDGTQQLLSNDHATRTDLIAVMNGKAIFGQSDAAGTNLYGSDGTAAGTALLSEFDGSGPLRVLGPLGTRLVLVSTPKNVSADKIVIASDGSTSGTATLLNIGDRDIEIVFRQSGRIFLTASGDGDVRSYVSDGTPTGTRLIGTGTSETSITHEHVGQKTLVAFAQGGEVSARFWVDDTTGAVVVAGSEYDWLGPVSQNWNDSGNWVDETLGTSPALVAPGAQDSVTFAGQGSTFQVIGGTGEAAYLTLTGNNAVIGQFSVGSLKVGLNSSNATLRVEAGGSLIAKTAEVLTAISVTGAGAALRAGSLSLLRGSPDIGDSSIIEVGPASGTATPGSVTVTKGGLLDIGNGATLRRNGSSSFSNLAPLANDGLVRIVDSNTIGDTNIGALSGNGHIRIEAGEQLAVRGAITGSNTIAIGDGALLTISASSTSAAGTTVSFAGAGSAMVLTAPVLSASKLGDVATLPTLVDFGNDDALMIDGAAVASAVYTAPALPGGNGTITLKDAGDTTLGVLAIRGSYEAPRFLALPIAGGRTQVALDLRPGISIKATDATKPEGHAGPTQYTFVIERTGDASLAQTVNYAVSAGDIRPADPSDFIGGVFPSGSVTLQPGDMTAVLTIDVAGDTAVETNELFNVSISTAETETLIIADTAIGTIMADDAIGDLAVASSTTGEILDSEPAFYTGPVPGVEKELLLITPDNVNISVAGPNWFIRSGGGNDAIAVASGTNVLDGSTGSNFLSGGTGADTFFLDARDTSQPIWSTVLGFDPGDGVTIWGVTNASHTLTWADGEGAEGYEGLTLHATSPGNPAASLTLNGYTAADLAPGGRLAVFPNNFEPASGSSYIYIFGL